eukprot:5474836-Amphidinium_carterae.2
MADDLRMVLSHEMSRGSSFSESHLAAVRDLALQCQQPRVHQLPHSLGMQHTPDPLLHLDRRHYMSSPVAIRTRQSILPSRST